MSYYDEARARAKRVKSPWNLLQIPFTIGGTIAVIWALLKLVLLAIGVFRSDHATLDSYSVGDVREFIVIPLGMAAFPVGMMLSNIVIWLIPPLRKIQEKEAVGYKGTDFFSAMRGLGRIAIFSVPIGVGISLLVAALGH